MSFLDDLLNFPKDLRALRVAASKTGKRSFDVTAPSELLADWSGVEDSINQDLRGNLQTIRSRARNLAKNNDHVVRFLGLVRTNVVGPNGFKLQMDIKKLVRGDAGEYIWQQDNLANTLIETAWLDWSTSRECSMSGRHSFRSLCIQVMEYVVRDGEAIVRVVKDKSNPFGTRLQVIDPDALDETYSERLASGNLVVMGVEVDMFRRPIAYHFRKESQAMMLYGSQGYGGERVRIPAGEILHIFDQKFESQTRGLSWLVQSMVRLRMLHGYEIAAVVNARAGANKHGVWIPSIDAQGDVQYTGTNDNGNPVTESAPGENVVGKPGWQFEAYDPAYPNGEHKDFVKAVLRSISSGLGVNYNLLGNDLEGVNYTSLRAGALDERETWMLVQNWFAEQFLRPMFSIWLERALLLSKIGYTSGSSLPVEKFEKFNRPVWIGRRWDWVDPLKDMEAIQLALQLGYTSLARELASRGEDVEETFAEIKWVKELAAKYGVTLDFGKSGGSAPIPASSQEDMIAAAKKALMSNNGHNH